MEKELHTLLAKSHEQERTHRQKITSEYQQFLSKIKQDDMVQSVASDAELTKLQAKRSKAIQYTLEDDIFRLELPTKKLKLLELKEVQNTLLSAFYTLPEFHSLGLKKPLQDNIKMFTDLKASLARDLERIRTLKPQFDELQKEFAECISLTDAQATAKELHLSKASVAIALDNLRKNIESHTLASDIRSRLIEEFNQSSNKKVLIKSYSGKRPFLDSLLSYDPTSVLKRAINITGYKPQQSEKSLSAEFLMLLNLQQEIIYYANRRALTKTSFVEKKSSRKTKHY